MHWKLASSSTTSVVASSFPMLILLIIITITALLSWSFVSAVSTLDGCTGTSQTLDSSFVTGTNDFLNIENIVGCDLTITDMEVSQITIDAVDNSNLTIRNIKCRQNTQYCIQFVDAYSGASTLTIENVFFSPPGNVASPSSAVFFEIPINNIDDTFLIDNVTASFPARSAATQFMAFAVFFNSGVMNAINNLTINNCGVIDSDITATSGAVRVRGVFLHAMTNARTIAISNIFIRNVATTSADLVTLDAFESEAGVTIASGLALKRTSVTFSSLSVSNCTTSRTGGNPNYRKASAARLVSTFTNFDNITFEDLSVTNIDLGTASPGNIGIDVLRIDKPITMDNFNGLFEITNVFLDGIKGECASSATSYTIDLSAVYLDSNAAIVDYITISIQDISVKNVRTTHRGVSGTNPWFSATKLNAIDIRGRIYFSTILGTLNADGGTLRARLRIMDVSVTETNLASTTSLYITLALLQIEHDIQNFHVVTFQDFFGGDEDIGITTGSATKAYCGINMSASNVIDSISGPDSVFLVDNITIPSPVTSSLPNLQTENNLIASLRDFYNVTISRLTYLGAWTVPSLLNLGPGVFNILDSNATSITFADTIRLRNVTISGIICQQNGEFCIKTNTAKHLDQVGTLTFRDISFSTSTLSSLTAVILFNGDITNVNDTVLIENIDGSNSGIQPGTISFTGVYFRTGTINTVNSLVINNILLKNVEIDSTANVAAFRVVYLNGLTDVDDVSITNLAARNCNVKGKTMAFLYGLDTATSELAGSGTLFVSDVSFSNIDIEETNGGTGVRTVQAVRFASSISRYNNITIQKVFMTDVDLGNVAKGSIAFYSVAFERNIVGASASVDTSSFTVSNIVSRSISGVAQDAGSTQHVYFYCVLFQSSLSFFRRYSNVSFTDISMSDIQLRNENTGSFLYVGAVALRPLSDGSSTEPTSLIFRNISVMGAMNLRGSTLALTAITLLGAVSGIQHFIIEDIFMEDSDITFLPSASGTKKYNAVSCTGSVTGASGTSSVFLFHNITIPSADATVSDHASYVETEVDLFSSVSGFFNVTVKKISYLDAMVLTSSIVGGGPVVLSILDSNASSIEFSTAMAYSNITISNIICPRDADYCIKFGGLLDPIGFLKISNVTYKTKTAIPRTNPAAIWIDNSIVNVNDTVSFEDITSSITGGASSGQINLFGVYMSATFKLQSAPSVVFKNILLHDSTLDSADKSGLRSVFVNEFLDVEDVTASNLAIRDCEIAGSVQVVIYGFEQASGKDMKGSGTLSVSDILVSNVNVSKNGGGDNARYVRPVFFFGTITNYNNISINNVIVEDLDLGDQVTGTIQFTNVYFHNKLACSIGNVDSSSLTISNVETRNVKGTVLSHASPKTIIVNSVYFDSAATVTKYSNITISNIWYSKFDFRNENGAVVNTELTAISLRQFLEASTAGNPTLFIIRNITIANDIELEGTAVALQALKFIGNVNSYQQIIIEDFWLGDDDVSLGGIGTKVYRAMLRASGTITSSGGTSSSVLIHNITHPSPASATSAHTSYVQAEINVLDGIYDFYNITISTVTYLGRSNLQFDIPDNIIGSGPVVFNLLHCNATTIHIGDAVANSNITISNITCEQNAAFCIHFEGTLSSIGIIIIEDISVYDSTSTASVAAAVHFGEQISTVNDTFAIRRVSASYKSVRSGSVAHHAVYMIATATSTGFNNFIISDITIHNSNITATALSAASLYGVRVTARLQNMKTALFTNITVSNAVVKATNLGIFVTALQFTGILTGESSSSSDFTVSNIAMSNVVVDAEHPRTMRAVEFQDSMSGFATMLFDNISLTELDFGESPKGKIVANNLWWEDPITASTASQNAGTSSFTVSKIIMRNISGRFGGGAAVGSLDAVSFGGSSGVNHFASVTFTDVYVSEIRVNQTGLSSKCYIQPLSLYKIDFVGVFFTSATLSIRNIAITNNILVQAEENALDVYITVVTFTGLIRGFEKVSIENILLGTEEIAISNLNGQMVLGCVEYHDGTSVADKKIEGTTGTSSSFLIHNITYPSSFLTPDFAHLSAVTSSTKVLDYVSKFYNITISQMSHLGSFTVPTSMVSNVPVVFSILDCNATRIYFENGLAITDSNVTISNIFCATDSSYCISFDVSLTNIGVLKISDIVFLDVTSTMTSVAAVQFGNNIDNVNDTLSIERVAISLTRSSFFQIDVYGVQFKDLRTVSNVNRLIIDQISLRDSTIASTGSATQAFAHGVLLNNIQDVELISISNVEILNLHASAVDRVAVSAVDASRKINGVSSLVLSNLTIKNCTVRPGISDPNAGFERLIRVVFVRQEILNSPRISIDNVSIIDLDLGTWKKSVAASPIHFGKSISIPSSSSSSSSFIKITNLLTNNIFGGIKEEEGEMHVSSVYFGKLGNDDVSSISNYSSIEISDVVMTDLRLNYYGTATAGINIIPIRFEDIEFNNSNSSNNNSNSGGTVEIGKISLSNFNLINDPGQTRVRIVNFDGKVSHYEKIKLSFLEAENMTIQSPSVEVFAVVALDVTNVDNNNNASSIVIKNSFIEFPNSNNSNNNNCTASSCGLILKNYSSNVPLDGTWLISNNFLNNSAAASVIASRQEDTEATFASTSSFMFEDNYVDMTGEIFASSSSSSSSPSFNSSKWHFKCNHWSRSVESRFRVLADAASAVTNFDCLTKSKSFTDQGDQLMEFELSSSIIYCGGFNSSFRASGTLSKIRPQEAPSNSLIIGLRQDGSSSGPLTFHPSAALFFYGSDTEVSKNFTVSCDEILSSSSSSSSSPSSMNITFITIAQTSSPTISFQYLAPPPFPVELRPLETITVEPANPGIIPSDSVAVGETLAIKITLSRLPIIPGATVVVTPIVTFNPAGVTSFSLVPFDHTWNDATSGDPLSKLVLIFGQIPTISPAELSFQISGSQADIYNSTVISSIRFITVTAPPSSTTATNITTNVTSATNTSSTLLANETTINETSSSTSTTTTTTSSSTTTSTSTSTTTSTTTTTEEPTTTQIENTTAAATPSPTVVPSLLAKDATVTIGSAFKVAIGTTATSSTMVRVSILLASLSCGERLDELAFPTNPTGMAIGEGQYRWWKGVVVGDGIIVMSLCLIGGIVLGVARTCFLNDGDSNDSHNNKSGNNRGRRTTALVVDLHHGGHQQNIDPEDAERLEQIRLEKAAESKRKYLSLQAGVLEKIGTFWVILSPFIISGSYSTLIYSFGTEGAAINLPFGFLLAHVPVVLPIWAAWKASKVMKVGPISDRTKNNNGDNDLVIEELEAADEESNFCMRGLSWLFGSWKKIEWTVKKPGEKDGDVNNTNGSDTKSDPDQQQGGINLEQLLSQDDITSSNSDDNSDSNKNPKQTDENNNAAAEHFAQQWGFFFNYSDSILYLYLDALCNFFISLSAGLMQNPDASPSFCQANAIFTLACHVPPTVLVCWKRPLLSRLDLGIAIILWVCSFATSLVVVLSIFSTQGDQKLQDAVDGLSVLLGVMAMITGLGDMSRLVFDYLEKRRQKRRKEIGGKKIKHDKRQEFMIDWSGLANDVTTGDDHHKNNKNHKNDDDTFEMILRQLEGDNNNADDDIQIDDDDNDSISGLVAQFSTTPSTNKLDSSSNDTNNNNINNNVPYRHDVDYELDDGYQRTASEEELENMINNDVDDEKVGAARNAELEARRKEMEAFLSNKH